MKWGRARLCRLFAMLASFAVVACSDPVQVNETTVNPATDGRWADAGDGPGAVVLSGEALFTACQGCHSLRRGKSHKVGPNLHGIIGQPAATREGYNYSDALKRAGIVWSQGTLTAWMLSPETMVPGNWMLYQNHLTPLEVQELTQYLIDKTSVGSGAASRAATD